MSELLHPLTEAILAEAPVNAQRVVFLFFAALPLWLFSTVLFDVVHWSLHWMARSPWRLLRFLGGLHQAHHEFFGADLQTHGDYRFRNMVLHIVPEFGPQVLFSFALMLCSLQLGMATLALQTLIFVRIVLQGGNDAYHRPIDVLTAYPRRWLGTARYHALHHLYPHSYFSAYVLVFDRLLGTACDLEARRFGVVGGQSDFGREVALAIGRSSVHPVVDLDSAPSLDALKRIDVLMLLDTAEGPLSQSRWLDGCRTLSQERTRPLDVWLAVPEHSHEWNGLVSKWALASGVIFRSFELPSGPQPLAPEIAAQRTLSLARRDRSGFLLNGNSARLAARFDQLIGR